MRSCFSSIPVLQTQTAAIWRDALGPIPYDKELALAWEPNGAGGGRLEAAGGDGPNATASNEEHRKDGGGRMWAWADPVELGAEEQDSAACTLPPFGG